MVEHTGQDLRGSRFANSDLRDSWFREVDMRGTHFRGVFLMDAEIDGEIDGLTIHGVEVAPLVEAELDRRHPERAALRATTPEELRAGWAGLEGMWAATLERVAAMPPETTDISVDGEWSFSQTLRHLVLATDAWLGLAVLQRENPFHPLGVLFSEWRGHEAELGIDADASPSYAQVLEAREDRAAMVRDFLAHVTADELAAASGARPPWEKHGSPTTLECLQVVMNEEWQHHRFAVRDLGAIEAGRV
ncbi:DinB family protein [Georgenia halophila]